MALADTRPFHGAAGGPAGILCVCLLAYAGATLLSDSTAERALLLAVGGVVGALAFFRTEVAVHLLICSMLLSPEIVVGPAAGATLARPITLRVDDLLILLISVTWFLKSVLYKDLDLIRRTPLNSAIFFYAIVCVVATLVGVIAGRVNPLSGGLFVVKYIEYFLVFWMLTNTIQSQRQAERYLITIFLVALIVGVVAIAQIPSGGRVSAPFEGANGEPNTLGGYLLFMIALLGGIACTWNRWRPVVLITLGTLLLALAYTLSRASYLGFLPLLVLIPVLTRRYWILALIGVAALGTLMFPGLLPDVVYDRVMFTFTQQETLAERAVILGQRVDSSTSARLFMFGQALDAFIERPVLGWGVTGWRFVDSQYFRTLVETGLVGLASFIFLLYRVGRVAWSSRAVFRDSNRMYFGLSCGFIAGLCGLLLHGLGSNTFIIVRIMEPFWLCAAILVVLNELSRRARAGEPGQLRPVPDDALVAAAPGSSR